MCLPEHFQRWLAYGTAPKGESLKVGNSIWKSGGTNRTKIRVGENPLAQACSLSFCFLAAMRWVALLHYRFPRMDPNDQELKPLKPWTKRNLLLFPCHSSQNGAKKVRPKCKHRIHSVYHMYLMCMTWRHFHFVLLAHRALLHEVRWGSLHLWYQILEYFRFLDLRWRIMGLMSSLTDLQRGIYRSTFQGIKESEIRGW